MDLQFNIINNIYTSANNTNLSYLHVCLFPLKSESIVLLFTENQGNKYSELKKQLAKQPEDKSLSSINYLMFLYFENYYISKNIDEAVIINEVIRIVTRLTDRMLSPNLFDIPIEEAKYVFDLDNHVYVPNFLSEKHCIIF